VTYQQATASSPIAISAAERPAGEAWDALVERDPHGTFCQLSGWKEVMKDGLGHQVIQLEARDADGVLRGLLPLVRVRSLLSGRSLISMPFLNYGGPVGTPEARERLLAEAVEMAESERIDVLEIRARVPVAGPPTSAPAKVMSLLDLPDTVEALWSDTFRAKLRSQIRRPIKEGMKLRAGPDQLDAFYTVFKQNMRDLGTPVLPRRFFESLRSTFPDEALFTAVYHEEMPVAGGCGLLWRGEFEITWASSLREFNRMSPNMLLYAGTMEEVIRRGGSTFNFGRSTPGGGTHRFKRQWGGRDVPLPWFVRSRRSNETGTRPAGRAHDLAAGAWQRMPLPLADRLGPVLARWLP